MSNRGNNSGPRGRGPPTSHRHPPFVSARPQPEPERGVARGQERGRAPAKPDGASPSSGGGRPAAARDVSLARVRLGAVSRAYRIKPGWKVSLIFSHVRTSVRLICPSVS